MITHNGENYITRREAAKLLGVSASSVTNLIKRGHVNNYYLLNKKLKGLLKEGEILQLDKTLIEKRQYKSGDNKKCSCCGEIKLIKEFIHSHKSGWLKPDCKSCRNKKYRANKDDPEFILNRRISKFQRKAKYTNKITIEDVYNKFGRNPICYLTGQIMDFNDPNSYSLDHFIPISKGGDGDLNNMRITPPIINAMKTSILYEDFLIYCQTIVDYKKNQ